MTNEQWLVYLWSIYPNGEFQLFWLICLAMVMIVLGFSLISFNDDSAGDFSEEKQNKYLWKKLGKWKLILPSVFLGLLFLSNLVPNREYFAYIIATPYVVESGKSIMENLNDPNSKLSKLNQIMDKGLDKVLLELDKKDIKEK